MDYIRRRLSVHVEGVEHVLSEDEFLGMGNVLVLLAEPGGGKTALAKAVVERHHALSASATNFAEQGIRQAPLHDGALLIIDGLDEVAGRRWGDGVDRVISNLAHLENRKVLISCRAAEWEGARNRALLRRLYNADPIEGVLEPLSETEQLEFLGLVAPQRNARMFLLEASRRDLEPMLGNPQNLLLLLDAVDSDESWPATRSELFDRATRVAVREANELRVTSDRVPQARVLDAAGEIFAALLLSGAEGVDRIDSGDGSLPFLNSFTSISEIDRQAAIETRLFRSVGGTRFIPAHRTIAEYLGSRWLGKGYAQDSRRGG